MSTIANWAYTNLLTFWSSTHNAYGEPTYTKEYELPGAYKLETTLSQDGGVPGKMRGGSDTFYFEYLGTNPPMIGWKIALGSFASDPPVEAKEIVSVTVYDVAMFGEAIPDYQVGAQ